jgi:hypothetical protein
VVSNPAADGLARTILTFRLDDELIRDRVQRIHQEVLTQSRNIRQPNFTSIHTRDLEYLFAAYDERFFGGYCRQALNGSRIHFRLSRRMTRAGGTTKRFRLGSGAVSYEIAIACDLLFDGFVEKDRCATVGGLECANRLDALQRIFEHELVHLAEQLCWETSECTAARFQDIAARHFRHRTHTHHLITPRERAAGAGISIGHKVSFEFEGRRLVGRVNRVTKRVSVLVEDVNGQKYSNGLRYKKYYVPIGRLNPLDVTSETQ